jgi:uncharacterized protein YdaL
VYAIYFYYFISCYFGRKYVPETADTRERKTKKMKEENGAESKEGDKVTRKYLNGLQNYQFFHSYFLLNLLESDEVRLILTLCYPLMYFQLQRSGQYSEIRK